MIASFLSFLKYWKAGGAVLLALVLLGNFYLSQSRAQKLEALTQKFQQTKAQLVTERARFQSQLKQLEKIKQEDNERDEFRKAQSQKIKTANTMPMLFDDNLRNAYDSLRARQANSSAAAD